MSTSTAPNTALAPLRNIWRAAQARWATLAGREQRLLSTAAVLVGAALLWALAIAPAWRTLAAAPAQQDALDLQGQRMQALATEAVALRAVAPVPMDQAQAALSAATERLGAPSKLSLQGERAVLSLKGVSSAQLNAWLAEARAGARARVVEANLVQTSPGLYDGSLTLALVQGAGR